MRRGMLGVVGVGACLTLVLLLSGLVSSAPGSAAQEAESDPTATRAAEEAELADLRTRVAVLATEVAELGGADREALAGRLGGSRTGFDEAYGEPTAFIGADQVAYDVEDAGRLTVTFEDDRAVRLVVAPDRPAEKPSSEPDPADWTLEEAQEIAARFAPADAELAEPTGDGTEEDLATGATSAALVDDVGTPTASGCPRPGAGSFDVAFATPTPETVSVVTLTLGPEQASVPEPERGATRRPGGGGAFVSSSLPGQTTVNGLRVQGIQARFDAEGAQPAPEGASYVAVELGIENETGGDLSFEPGHFFLTDERARELTAVCGGVEPALAAGELAADEAVEGWVSFLVPEDFEPERFVYLVNGDSSVQVVFTLG